MIKMAMGAYYSIPLHTARVQRCIPIIGNRVGLYEASQGCQCDVRILRSASASRVKHDYCKLCNLDIYYGQLEPFVVLNDLEGGGIQS